MKLFLCKPRGFCAGVVRAIRTVEEALDRFGPPIYVKHEIVHNRHVVNALKQKGALFIENLCEIPPGSRVIYSAHGVSPEVRKEAKQRELIEIDATCILVAKVHAAVKSYASKGYHILLLGHRNHVEVKGVAGEAVGQVTVVQSIDEVHNLSFLKDQKLFCITQTTLSVDDVREMEEALYQKFPHLERFKPGSICFATSHRQLALKSVAHLVDLVLVVGDSMSSNSNRLCEVAKREGVKAFLVNSSDEIQEEWLNNVEALGITAGASTPEDQVAACLERLRQLGVAEVEEITYVDENVSFPVPTF